MNLTASYRYPGVKPFEMEDSDIFFGRDSDRANLLDRISLEKVVVLFGKSGYGKSSLLNAGLLPALRAEESLPIVVRFGNYRPGEKRSGPNSPISIVRQKIASVFLGSGSAVLARLNSESSLWSLLKEVQHLGLSKYVFIFDQFEEFFTYPAQDQNDFKEQIAELLFTKVPQAVRENLGGLSSEEFVFSVNEFDARVVFSIRWDRLGLLDSLKDKLPAILHNRYELKGLTRSQAREAIELPAVKIGDSFKTAEFTYSEDALNVILDELTKSSNTSVGGVVEAFQLQIICQSVESKVEQERLVQVELNDLPDLSDIYFSYYNRQIETLSMNMRDSARLVIEEELLDEQEGRRTSVDKSTLLKKPGVTQELLNRLEDTFLIRPERNTVGGLSYEVSHDTLIAPILHSKKARRLREEQLESERKIRDAEELAAKEKYQAEIEKARNEKLTRALEIAERAERQSKIAEEEALRALINEESAKRDALYRENEAEKAKSKALMQRRIAVIFGIASTLLLLTLIGFAFRLAGSEKSIRDEKDRALRLAMEVLQEKVNNQRITLSIMYRSKEKADNSNMLEIGTIYRDSIAVLEAQRKTNQNKIDSIQKKLAR